MTPKEMTNEQLVHRSEDRGAYVMEHGQDVGLGVHNELLRRLNEADTLRKENEELRRNGRAGNDAERRRRMQTLHGG